MRLVLKFAAGELAPSLGSSGSSTPWNSHPGFWGHTREVPAAGGERDAESSPVPAAGLSDRTDMEF